jgi:predicted metal-binding protein
MKRLGDLVNEAAGTDVDDARIIEASRVYTAPWVPMKCQFGCSLYGKGLCCPPHTPTPEKTAEILGAYRTAILLHRRWEKGYETVNRFNDAVVGLERKVFLAGYHKAWGLGSGPCMRCKKCDPANRCAHPELARPSMESCGIDVFRTVSDLGLPIKVVTSHSEARNIYGLVLVE